MSPYLWKSMKTGLRSGYNGEKWKIGQWKKIKGKVGLCSNGYHASKNIINAMQYTKMGTLAKVEVRGKSEKTDNKQVWSEMRIVQAWKWTKKDSVALTVYAAELVIDIFEKEYPNDQRPREAIEAAKTWLKNPTKKNGAAARDAAWDARDAAGDAAWDAAWDARDAAWDAAWAARDAAGDAAGAAWAARDAAWDAAMKKRHSFVLRRRKGLEEISGGK